MNVYKKYCANVYLAECTEKYEKGETIIVNTRYGKENKHIVHNLIYERDGKYYYSITREDGYNIQEKAKKKAENYKKYSENAEKRSNDYYEASQEGRDFLSLAEPIKVGHHSERRHRKLIERNHKRMEKCVEEHEKAKEYEERAKYWETQKKVVNLSMPESIEYYKYKLEKAQEIHKQYKEGNKKKEHSYSLNYLTRDIRDFKKKIEIAEKLRG